MKGAGWIVVGIVAAVAGMWWWSRRRSAVVGVEYFAPGHMQIPLGAYASTADLPQLQTGGGNWKDTAANAYGAVSQTAAQGYCVSQGGDPRGCQIAGQVANVAGKYTAKGAIKVGEGAVSAGKAVGRGSKKVLKAIIPGW